MASLPCSLPSVPFKVAIQRRDAGAGQPRERDFTKLGFEVQPHVLRVARLGGRCQTEVSPGWTVRDTAGHIYTFGTLRLGAGKQAIIHAGKGTSNTTSASAHLYWGRGWYVWNNTGDKVILRRADGSLKDTCTYSGAGSKKYC